MKDVIISLSDEIKILCDRESLRGGINDENNVVVDDNNNNS